MLMRNAPRDDADYHLEIEARRLANEAAREEYGEGGVCLQLARIEGTRRFRAYIAYEDGNPGVLLGKSIVVSVKV
ncbi:hypothetical protein GXW78_09845 [Roseomonas terrae]|uniref:Uncharacterized protein n=1 Tax=Neoroseomonas terrae TaxID=424799 RepID=A0ABS5EG18_9PROT|nr:hypothetical protein [Neoroseomonas terrae]MBR0649965.1 hypothetical protein [Neoroseomonas terrae]